jgi:hypothetical protein
MGRRTVDRKVGAQPPANLEKLVRWLVPASSREHVVGDLNERYRSPGRYLVDALCVLPFVIASQVRRSSSLPRVVVRAFVLWYGAFLGTRQESWLVATLPTVLATVALILRDAYRPTAPSSPSPTPPFAAAFDIAMVCACVLVTETAAALWAPELLLSRQALVFGVPFGCAVLFILRVQNPPRSIWATPAPMSLSYAELVTEVRGYEAVWQRALRIEMGLSIALVVLTPLVCFAFPWIAPDPIARLGFGTTAAGALFVALLLHKRWRLERVPDELSFAETLASYRQNLQRQIERSRAYVWWYLVPIVLGPTVLVLGPLFRHPGAMDLPIGGVATLVVVILMILVVRRASLNTYKKRIDQLGVVAETL